MLPQAVFCFCLLGGANVPLLNTPLKSEDMCMTTAIASLGVSSLCRSAVGYKKHAASLFPRILHGSVTGADSVHGSWHQCLNPSITSFIRLASWKEIAVKSAGDASNRLMGLSLWDSCSPHIKQPAVTGPSERSPSGSLHPPAPSFLLPILLLLQEAFISWRSDGRWRKKVH